MRGNAMSSFEWMELQTLTADIAASRARLVAARSGKDHRLARTLEQEITAAEDRRNRLLAHITNHVATGDEQKPPPRPELADSPAGPDETPQTASGDAEARPSSKAAARMVADAAASPASAPEVESTKGGSVVWDQ